MAKPKSIWSRFLKEEEREFAELHNYGKEEILKVGYEEFIKVQGWEKLRDVKSWRTDKLHLMPCPACGKSFGIFDDVDFGLCKSCLPRYDVSRFWGELMQLADTPEKLVAGMQLFLTHDKLRNNYLKPLDQGGSVECLTNNSTNNLSTEPTSPTQT